MAAGSSRRAAAGPFRIARGLALWPPLIVVQALFRLRLLLHRVPDDVQREGERDLQDHHHEKEGPTHVPLVPFALPLQTGPDKDRDRPVYIPPVLSATGAGSRKVSRMTSWYSRTRPGSVATTGAPRSCPSTAAARAASLSRHSSGVPATAIVSSISSVTSAVIPGRSKLFQRSRIRDATSMKPCNSRIRS